MAFTFNDALTTDEDRVRLNLGDTDTAAHWFEDATITALLASEGSVDDATAACLRALLASKGLRMKRFAVEGLSYDDTAQLAALKYALSLYGGGLPTLAVISPAPMPMDEAYVEITLA